MYQALYRKYRPDKLSDVVGQKVIVNTLKNSIKNNKITHAYLFTGPRGTGKTSIAKAFAKLINCENIKDLNPCNECLSCIKNQAKQNVDIIEIDAASNNGVDEIREIRNKVSLVPTYSKYKVYIIDEVHMLTTGAFNALLKTLEEPPQHVIFILATTEPHKIPTTILSRCQRFDFKKISDKEIVERLKYISEQEKIDISISALQEIAILSDGGMRDSISLLDQVVSYVDFGEQITELNVHEVSGTLCLDEISKFIEYIINSDLENVLTLLNKYDENGINIKKFIEQLINFFEKIILSKETPKYLENITDKIDVFDKYKKIDNSKIFKCIEMLSGVLNKIVNTTNPKIMLEVCLIQIVEQLKNNNIISTKQNYEIKIEEKNKNVSKVHKKQIEDNINEIVTYKIKDFDLYKKFKEQRINNVLADLNKNKIKLVKESIEQLKLKILDPIYGKTIALLLDSQIKATSKEGIIIVFEEKSSSESFNENIPLVEKLFSTIGLNDFKIISTYLEDWNEIKNEFNNKQKKYEYEIKLINENDVYEITKKSENEIQEIFNDCIEYV